MKFKDGKWEEREKPLDIWEEFRDDLTLPKEESEKQTALYFDKEYTDHVTDYLGETREVYEKSCVAIVDIPFSMSMDEDFIQRIEELRHERERMVYGGVL